MYINQMSQFGGSYFIRYRDECDIYIDSKNI